MSNILKAYKFNNSPPDEGSKHITSSERENKRALDVSILRPLRRGTIQSTKTIVGTTATEITTPEDTRDIVLKNNGTDTIWLKGDSSVGVDADGSYPLGHGETLPLDNMMAHDCNELWGIVDTGTQPVFAMGVIRDE